VPRHFVSEHALGEHGRTTNLYDLFLSLYRSVAENGISEVVRAVFSPWESAKYQEWRNSSHPLCHAIAEVIGNNANDWLDDFPRMRDGLLGRLAEWANEAEHQSDAIEKEVACVVTTLRELDLIVGQALGFPLGPLTYPSPPRSDGYSLVRKPNAGFYSQYRMREDLEAPPALAHGEFTESLGLVSTYVVHPLAGEHYFEWSIERAPALSEGVWREQMAEGKLSFVLLSFPHTVKPTLAFGEQCFLLKDLGPAEADVGKEVLKKVQTIAEEGGASVVVFPELTAHPDLVAGLKAQLAALPNRIGLVIPGSRHAEISSGVWRNRCTALDPIGSDSTVTHDKVTRYALPRKMAAEYGQRGEVEFIECSEAPRRIRLYDSFTLGRFAVLICRDVIEPQIPEFLRQHFLDHVFVVAMTPDLRDFLGPCSQLGRILDAGVFVANMPFDAPQPALIYLPVRAKPGFEECPPGSHEVCLQTTHL
jgi:hypothetical protein